jgi:hypothetical protein
LAFSCFAGEDAIVVTPLPQVATQKALLARDRIGLRVDAVLEKRGRKMAESMVDITLKVRRTACAAESSDAVAQENPLAEIVKVLQVSKAPWRLVLLTRPL